MVNLEVRFD